MCRRMMYVVVVMMLGLAPMNLVYGFNPGSPGLLAWWTCDEGEGAVVGDASVNGRDGTFVYGDPAWGPGIRGSAIELVGPTLVEVPPLDMVLTEATMAGWIKPNGPQPDWSSFIMQRDPGLATGFNILGYQLAYHWNDTSDSWSFRGGDMIAEDEWTFAAVTIEPDRATFYVNGVAGSVNEITHGPCDWNSNIYLGGDGTAGWVSRRTNGALDDVSMFSRALTAEEIVTVMDGIEPAPFISVSTLDDWSSLLNRPEGVYPRIDPVKADEFRSMVIGNPGWPTQYRGAAFATPALDARDFDDEFGQVGPRLYMSWGPEGAEVVPGVYNAAAWDYDYGVATDFSNVELEFFFLAPVFSTLFSVNILDEDGNWREFIWHVSEITEIPPREWTTIRLNPSNEISNFPFEVDPFEGGGDFQLNRTRRIRFNENVSWNGDFPLDNGWVWNDWANLEVRPGDGPVNLLENGGFEDGVMEPWSTYGNVTTEVVQTNPIEGAYCLNLVVPEAGANFWDAGLQHAGHVFEAGKNYTLSAWLKSSQGTLDINFKPELGESPWTGYGEQAFTMTEEWAEYSVTTGVFDEDVSPATITFHIAYAPGDFFVDDVKFVEIE